MFELEHIALVGGRECHGTQLALGVATSMELESVVPALPVLAKGGRTFGHPVFVGTHEPTDFEHGGVGKAELSSARQDSSQQAFEFAGSAVHLRHEALVAG